MVPRIPRPPIHAIIRAIFGTYMRVYHRLEVDIPADFPRSGPMLGIMNHASHLDAVAYGVADPSRPPAVVVVKDSLLRVPIVRSLIRCWGVIPVSRDGHDVAALRGIATVLRQGRRIAVAAEGTRSRDGRLGPLNRVLVKLIVDVASRGVPVVLGVAIGTQRALPPRARWPRPHKVRVVVGMPIDLSPWTRRKLSDADLEAVGAFIQAQMASMLPPEQRPRPGTPAITPARPPDRATQAAIPGPVL